MGRIYRPVEITSNSNSIISVALVDTGADETVISERVANRINAEVIGEFIAVCASRTEIRGSYAMVTIKELWSGKQTRLEVGVSDAPFNTDDIDDEGIDVILGIDFLQDTKLNLYFEEGIF